ncbi:MAG: YhjD/YihY/BrkB family envelope integrity protein, partial [Cyanobacteria bacterium P01_H01_bin.58]
THHRDWMRAAAMTHGFLFCIGLGSLSLLMGMTLNPEFNTLVSTGLTHWRPDVGLPITSFITQTMTEWTPLQRMWVSIVGGGTTVSLWLKLIGTTQHILRETRPGTPPAPASLRQRLNTVLIASITLLLLGFVVGLAFSALIESTEAAIAASSYWQQGQKALAHFLRWSLAISSLSLMFGLLYRFSLSRPIKVQPILPGTVLATVVGMGLIGLLKLHLSGVATQHWFYTALSTMLVVLGGLYCFVLGGLMGARFNILVKYHIRNHQPSPLSTALTAPPSFESFTIKRRSDRGW